MLFCLVIKIDDLRAVKKNCTIPSWLNFEAEKAGVNFSAILIAALKFERGEHEKAIEIAKNMILKNLPKELKIQSR